MDQETCTYDDISAVGRAGAPSVLITVRSVEDSPSLRDIAVSGQYEKTASERRTRAYVSSGVLSHKVGHRNYRLHTIETCVNKRFQMQLVAKMARYLSNGRASQAAVGSPLEFGDSFLFGGTDGAPERCHVLTAGTSVSLYKT